MSKDKFETLTGVGIVVFCSGVVSACILGTLMMWVEWYAVVVKVMATTYKMGETKLTTNGISKN